MAATQRTLHPKIFISHSWADKELVRRLETELKTAGAEVWVDHAEVRAGDSLPKEISDALAWCDTVLLVWSRDAAQSHWVELEWACAVALRKLIIPCRADKTGLPALLSNLLYIDFSSVSQGMSQLREVVLSAQKPVAQTPATPAERLARFLRFQVSGELPAIWNVHLHRNPNFTGRAELFAELRAALTKDKTAALTQAQAIHGLGGVGKTQLALEYAYRFAAEFQIVWWLRAEEAATLAADFAALATALELPEKEAQDQTAIIQAVRQWLDHHTGWLLIFDNAQQPQDLLPYLPQSMSGQVLITSRNPQWKEVAHAFKVQVWPRAESIAFLLRRSGAQDEQAADDVAQALGDLPLALEQASAYVEATGVSIADYLTLFQQYRAELLQEHQPLEYDATVATTWEISFQKLKTEDPAAVDLLNALSFLAPDNIPRALLIDGREHLPKKLSKALSKPLETNRAIASLARYSLVEASSESFSQHRLVQAVTRDRMPAELKKTWAAAMVKLMADAYPHGEKSPDDVRHWPACEALLAHVLSVAEYAEKYIAELKQVATLFNQTGIYLYSRAQYATAEPLYRRSLEIREKQLGPDHPFVATGLNNLALLLKTQGQYAAAEPLYHRSLEIREKQLGPDHPDVAQSLNNLAELLRAQGQYAAAEPLYRRSLEIEEKQLGRDHPSVATSLNNLALLLSTQGQYAAAEPLYRRAIAIREKHQGRDHPDLATNLNNLGGLLESQGQYAAAEPLFRRSLEILEKQLGRDHPYVATGLNNLAELLRAQGQYTAAEPLYRRSLEIKEKQLGPEHPSVATGLNNLAELLRAQGQYAAADPLYRRSLEIFEKSLGPDHPNTRTVRENLALLKENLP